MASEQNGNLRVQKLLNQLSDEYKAGSGVFDGVEEAPKDAIFAVKAAFKDDQFADKVNLGIGAYRDENGKPYVLKVVRKVEKELANEEKYNKEYLPISGDAEYVKLTQELMLGSDSRSIKNGTIAGVQALSGTGALRVLFNFIKNNMYKPGFNVWVSKPTWGNHNKVIWKSGLAKSKQDTMKYNYLDSTQTKFDLEGMTKDLSQAKPGDVVLLHGCAHNPSGVDPKPDEWKKIADFMKEKKLVPFFDCAYQGFATGDLEKDAFAVRLFEKEGFEFLLAQSFAKNLGLYCERAGCASVVTKSKQASANVFSQLKAVIRPMYSNPPGWGARIVKEVLGSSENQKLWQQELNLMSGRIKEMRILLRKNLEDLETPGPGGKLGDKCDKDNSWRHITDQIGMFSYTGVTGKDKVVEIIRKKYHVYMLENGRISMAGINPKNVERVAKALNAAIVGLNDKNKVDGRD